MTGIISDKAIVEFNEILNQLLLEEVSPLPSTGHEIIIYTHLDKLLQEIIESRYMWSAGPKSRLNAIFIKSGSLVRKWQRRFKEQYFNIDQARTEAMKTNGALCGLTLADKDGGHESIWIVSCAKPSNLEGHLSFCPGE